MSPYFELIAPPQGRAQFALFDFDGTISLIRAGWQQVMTPYFTEILMQCPGAGTEGEMQALAREHIDRLTGKQTIYQCMWLADEVTARGGTAEDAMAYKQEYLRRLAIHTAGRIGALENGAEPDEFMVAGSRAFLERLAGRGVRMYLASGTDTQAVRHEAKLLRVDHLFAGIYGAEDADRMRCAKEAVLHRLIDENGLNPHSLAAFGDGPVELELVSGRGGYAVGIAVDEEKGGLDQVKLPRLKRAGAHAIAADFTESRKLENLLFGGDA